MADRTVATEAFVATESVVATELVVTTKSVMFTDVFGVIRSATCLFENLFTILLDLGVE